MRHGRDGPNIKRPGVRPIDRIPGAEQGAVELLDLAAHATMLRKLPRAAETRTRNLWI
jgi:hypothetical protein